MQGKQRDTRRARKDLEEAEEDLDELFEAGLIGCRGARHAEVLGTFKHYHVASNDE